ncbi:MULTISPECIES: LPS translocon maturation chaperone LptM [Thiomicrorhabdus]|uniref:Lipoprotein n=1 Tax=Thiomicrorhabdus heinhorstiae TaxID=2748010 RepID=A0ABS0BVD0_9GAMM|nr:MULTISPECIES: lipoprotein [Thiomicrorhabdus]MBF6057792.1 lipoprotein [Thiomicrorhabdus heinhorstiae]
MHISLSVLLICCSLALSACGKKGSLYVEEEPQPATSQEVQPPPAEPNQQ